MVARLSLPEEGELDDLLCREHDHRHVVVACEDGCCGREGDDVCREAIWHGAQVESGLAVFTELSEAEDLTRRAYAAALAERLLPRAEQTVRRQLGDIQEAHRHVRMLREAHG